VRLYHWTTSDRAELIRQHGIRETNYDWPAPGDRGVWTSDGPETGRGRHGTALIEFDIPDELIEQRWLKDRGRLIPGEVANRYVLPAASP
jgi:hypothetical protein